MADRITEACPFCGWDAIIRQLSLGREGKDVECVICGRFEITPNALAGLTSKPGDTELLPYLICHIRQANERGEVFNVASHTWREFATAHKNTPFSKKTAKLLDILAARSRFIPGARIPVDSKVDWPLVDAGSQVELDYLLEFLLKEDYINKKYEPLVQLNPKAWERFEKLGTGQGTPGKCFVAMSFHKSLNDAYDSGIFLAVKSDCQMEPVRVDRVEHNEKICDRIIAEIRMCQFMVADFTGQRPAVFFEAGFALGLGRPVIWSCRNDEFEKLKDSFDTRQYNHIAWNNSEELRKKLADRIKATFPGAA